MKKWKDYNFDLLKLIYKRDFFFSPVMSKWWIALSVKAVWKTNLSIAVWPKKLENYPLLLKYAVISVVCSFFTSMKKKTKQQNTFFWNVHWWKCSRWENWWRSHFQRDGAIELLGQTHTQKGETGKSHLLNQKDLDDTFNLTAPMESIWCKTPAFHLLLKFSLKGTVPTPNLLGIHFYYSWVQFKDSSRSNGLL